MIGFADIREGGFSALDIALAESFAAIWPAADPDALVLAALASWAVGQGHSCFSAELLSARTARDAFVDDERVARALDAFASGSLQAPFLGAADAGLPLVQARGLLWLRRYWRYEREIETSLRARAAEPFDRFDPAAVRDVLDRLLPAGGEDETDWQRVAAVNALRSRLTVICGGPGTGKTFTVLRVLALLQQLSGKPLRIALAAPTGKAAQRLSESVRAGLAALPLSDVERATLPADALTLHRLLGFRPQAVYPARDAQRPLDLDVLVVDECSMVDLPLMAKLLRALKPEACLILLGDPDQLPAVENGAVLATLASCNPHNRFSAATAAWIAAASGATVPTATKMPAVGDAVVRLERPRRFGGDSGIARLVRAIRSGDAGAVFDALDGSDDIVWSETPLRLDNAAGVAHLRRAYAGLLDAREPDAALAALPRFRVLCALRDGPHGVAGLNLAIETALHGALARHVQYAGRPLLVTSNDHALGLFNGDVGVILGEKPGGALRAWFTRSDGIAHAFLPAQLPPHESAWAMTVHKAQGSEFDEVELVLPAEPHPLLTREWLYTAASRARQRLRVHAARAVIEAALRSGTRRINGLEFEWSAQVAEES